MAKIKLSLEEIQQKAREAMQAGEALRNEMRVLVLRALTQGELLESQVNETLGAISRGIQQGAMQGAADVKMHLTEALYGVDDALSHVAEVLQETLHDAAGEAKTYGKQELEQAFQQFKKLEEVLLESISKVAEGAGDMLKQEVENVVDRGRKLGTETGEKIRVHVENLGEKIRLTTEEASTMGKDTLKHLGSRVAEAASLKLAQTAELFAEKAKALRPSDSSDEI